MRKVWIRELFQNIPATLFKVWFFILKITRKYNFYGLVNCLALGTMILCQITLPIKKSTIIVCIVNLLASYWCNSVRLMGFYGSFSVFYIEKNFFEHLFTKLSKSIVK